MHLGVDPASLAAADVGCLPTLRALHYVELDGFALVQRLEAFRLDGREMDEYILAILPLNEPVAFCRVEPLYRACFQGTSPDADDGRSAQKLAKMR